MASCWVISGLVLIALAFIASAVSLVAPYWYHQRPEENVGLWANCEGEQKCKWFFEDEFHWEKGRPVWWKAAQGLFAFGTLLLLLAFLTACVFLCSACCKSIFSVIHLINGFLVFGFFTLAPGLVLFGVYANKDYGVTYDWNDSAYFSWGYWVGCGGALLTLLAIFLYVCECCRGRSHEGYQRGEVV